MTRPKKEPPLRTHPELGLPNILTGRRVLRRADDPEMRQRRERAKEMTPRNGARSSTL